MELLITLGQIALVLWIVGIVASLAMQYWVAKSMHDHLND